MQNAPTSQARIVTYSGRVVDLLNPSPASICIVDIAHALSHVNRFGGHTAIPYSVAQHSLLVASALWADTKDPAITLAGLLHDAAEAYVGDMSRPLKSLLPEFKYRIEGTVCRAICQALGAPMPFEFPEVKGYDNRALVTEAEHLGSRELVALVCESLPGVRPFDLKSLPSNPLCLSPAAAKELFLRRFVSCRNGEWCPCGNCTPPNFRY